MMAFREPFGCDGYSGGGAEFASATRVCCIDNYSVPKPNRPLRTSIPAFRQPYNKLRISTSSIGTVRLSVPTETVSGEEMLSEEGVETALDLAAIVPPVRFRKITIHLMERRKGLPE